MDHRCPLCRAEQKKQKFGQSLVARMNVECVHCGKLLRLNVHRMETVVVFLNFSAIVLLAILAYKIQSRELALAAVFVALAGSAALPLLERTYLRSWPRYVAAETLI